MEPLLLCGARGMLGRRLAESLASSYAVTATGRSADEASGVLGLDICDASAVAEMMQSEKPAWVVNAAAYTAVDKAESERDEAFRINAEGPRVLAEACAKAGSKLCHVSTDFVFGGDKDSPYVETDPVSPRGVYAQSKAKGEQWVRELLPDRHVIFRVAWLFGPDGGNFVATMLRLAGERDSLRVVDDQKGSPTYTRDAAEALRLVLESPVRGVVHGANREATTWCGLAREALRLSGSEVPVEAIATHEYPTPAPRPRNSALRNSVLEETIGHHMRPWHQALASYIAELSNPKG